MLPFAKYDNYKKIGQSIFPPVQGSHRKIKILPSPKESKNYLPTQNQGVLDEIYYVSHMKKARDIILSYEKAKRSKLKRNYKVDEKVKTEATEKMSPSHLPGKSSFSNVVYSMGNKYKKPSKKGSVELHNLGYKQKELRECQSSFMPNNNQNQGKFLFNIPKKQYTERGQTENTKPDMGRRNSTMKFEIANSADQKVMEHLFPDHLIKYSGQRLMAQLRKCRQKNQNPQNYLIQQSEESNHNIFNSSHSNSKQEEDQSTLKFPYQLLPKEKTKKSKSKFLQKKQKKMMQFRLGSSVEEIKKSSSSDESLLQQPINNRKSENKTEIIKYEGKDVQLKKIDQTFISKSMHLDENFVIDGWYSDHKISMIDQEMF